MHIGELKPGCQKTDCRLKLTWVAWVKHSFTWLRLHQPQEQCYLVLQVYEMCYKMCSDDSDDDSDGGDDDDGDGDGDDYINGFV